VTASIVPIQSHWVTYLEREVSGFISGAKFAEIEPMQVTAIIQARMSSHRLPGKVLKTVQGKTMLSYLYERLVHCRSLDSIVISTSTDPKAEEPQRIGREDLYFQIALKIHGIETLAFL
jgi:hypothetical protein